MEKIKAVRTEETAEQDKEQNVAFELVSQLVGKARKDKKAKRERTSFSKEQVKVMTECYDAGAQDKIKRFTPAMCQVVMEKNPNIGQENVLSEAQIRAFWSRLHSKVVNRNTAQLSNQMKEFPSKNQLHIQKSMAVNLIYCILNTL